MMKMGDIIIVADDDQVRTGASQNHVTATLCTEEFFVTVMAIAQWVMAIAQWVTAVAQ
jgi:hypothetical protein